MKPILVFYAGQLLLEFNDHKEFEYWRRATAVGNYELYNGSYVYVPSRSSFQVPEWYRMDSTPMLLADVPKNLQALVLLLT